MIIKSFVSALIVLVNYHTYASRLEVEVTACEVLDKEAEELTQELQEKQQKVQELQDLAERQKKYRDLLGSHDTSEMLEKHELLAEAKAKLKAKLEWLDKQLETQSKAIN